MPLNKATTTQNNFVNGWVTDFTGLNHPEQAATDSDNVVFDPDGRVYRREGFDVDPGGSTVTGVDTSGATSSHMWERVDGLTTKAFLVQQYGATLYVFDVSGTTVPTGAPVFTHTMVPIVGSTADPKDSKCDYTTGEGALIVTNGSARTFAIDYDPTGGTYSTSFVDIRVRDFTGMEAPAGEPEGTRLSSMDYATLRTTRPDYLYNLFNNGWTHAALVSWDGARTDMPALSESPCEFADDNGSFKVGKVKDEVGVAGNYGGHYALDAFSPNRQVLLEASASGTVANSATEVIPDTLSATTGSYGGMFTNKASAGGVSSATAAIDQLLACRVELYGSDVLPATDTSGTLLDAQNTPDNFDASLVLNPSSTTPMSYYWVRVTELVTPANKHLADNLSVSYSAQGTGSAVGALNDPEAATYARPTHVISFNNRIVYAGVRDDKRATNVYITRTITHKRDFSKTYQRNDPTNCKNAQLLSDDGLIVKIPEMVGLQELKVMGNDLILLASSGVWAITGSSGNSFSTKDFGVRKLSCAPCISGCAVVMVDDAPVWWTGSEIVTLSYNVQFHSYQVQSLSAKRIDNYLRDLPVRLQRHACGVYDCGEDQVFWLYNDGTNATLAETDYNRVLVLNVKTKAFYRWSGTPGSPYYISHPTVVHPGDKSSEGVVKYLCTDRAAGSFRYGGFSNPRHKDWLSLGLSIDTNYSSYFDTGYAVHGEGARKTQFGYVHIFLDQEDKWGKLRPSVYVQGRFSWAISGSTGKWSKQMQAYRPRRFKHSVARARIRVRGQGEAMQLHYRSEDEHPFSIIGWSSEELVPSKS